MEQDIQDTSESTDSSTSGFDSLDPRSPISYEGSQKSLPDLNVKGAFHILNRFSENPKFLANPFTADAANKIFSAASHVIQTHIQLQKLSQDAVAVKTQQHLVGEQIKMGDELARVAWDEVAPFYVPNEQGKLGIADLRNSKAIRDKYETLIAKPRRESANKLPLAKRVVGPSGITETYEQPKETADKPYSELGRILKDRAAAPDEEKPFYDSKLKAMEEKMGFAIQFDDQGRPIINYGPTTEIGKTTVATQTLAQRKLLKYEVATELMNHIQKNLETGHVGVAGFLGEMVGDRLLPQLGVDTFSGKRVDVRTALTTLRESLMREISDDSRFSNADREEISKALPSSGILESVQDARQRIETVRRIVAQRAGTYASGMGLPAPLWSLSPEQIRERFNLPANDPRKITEQQAADALRRFHGFE